MLAAIGLGRRRTTVSGMTAQPSRPLPSAPQQPHTWPRPTGDVSDPWAWLHDPENPETLAYLNEENAHAEAFFAEDATLVDTLFEEVRSRTKEDDTSPPVQRDGWWYASSTRSGAPYPVHTRGRSAVSATWTVVLDENAEAEGKEFFDVGEFCVSNDGSRLAWSLDTTGRERYALRVRDLTTGKDLPVEVPDTSTSGVAWSADDTHLFYVTANEAMRPWKVWRLALGADPSSAICVFTEEDERFTVGIGATRSGRWLVIRSTSSTTSECSLLDLSAPESPVRLVRPRVPGVEYTVDHWGNRFAIVTNLDATDFQVMLADEADPSGWRSFIKHVPGERIVDFDCFEGFAIMTRWVDAQPCLLHVGTSGELRRIDVLDEPHDVSLEANPNWRTRTIRIAYQSLTTPPTVAEWPVNTGSLKVLKRLEVPGVELGAFVAERTWAIVEDGTRVPLDVVRHRDTPLDGSAPALLYVYGAYEISLPPWFSTARLSLLERGWVWALAHPRGGGELGRQWYLDGKLEAKRNTFTDTIACARRLVEGGWTDADRIAVQGGSAGGLTVGACLNLEPELFAAAVLEVPFLDVVTTMSDPSLPLTVGEWEEWGDPRVEPFASLMASYSPYDNVRPVRYPDMYVTAGLNDFRVGFHEPAKWTAKIRHLSPETFVLFRCEMHAGHGGRSGRYERWRDQAKTTAFLLRRV